MNDGVIYASAGNALFALRADNGAILWTYRSNTTISLEASNIAGGFLYTFGDGWLQCSKKMAQYATSASPLTLMNGMIFVASFGGFNLPGNSSTTVGGNIYALRTDNRHIIWQKRFGSNDIPILPVDNGIVYFALIAPHK